MKPDPEPPPSITGKKMIIGSSEWSLANAFGIHSSGELVAIVGAGGKSSLMFSLARSLPGKVVTTTTTRIFSAQMRLAPAVCMPDQDARGHQANGIAGVTDPEEIGTAGGHTEPLTELGSILARYNHCLVVGRIEGEKASGISPELPGRLLTRPDVDTVLVEADGSRMRPCKAPAGHEPVIPVGTTLLIPVLGIDALGCRLADAAHRPELVADITGLKLDDKLTIEALAKLIVHPDGGMKNLPVGARLIPLINKVETDEKLVAARQIAAQVLKEERVDQVVVGAVKSLKPVVEVHRRVTAVVLAAGESQRMGQTKQVLPWGQTTILGQTLNNLRSSAVNEILVVTGHDREAVEAIAAQAQVPAVHNPAYDNGEMLSSLQVALRKLPANRTAVLVVLADQPFVEPETIDQLLSAFWRGKGEIIAPVHQGRRGNPVLIGRFYFDELLSLPAGSAPRDLLKRHSRAIHLVEVPTRSIFQDLDLPDQYDRWRPKNLR